MERSKWIGYGVKAVSAVLGVAGGMIISEKLGNKKKHEEVEQPTAEVIVPATEVATVTPEESNKTTETSETEN